MVLPRTYFSYTSLVLQNGKTLLKQFKVDFSFSIIFCGIFFLAPPSIVVHILDFKANTLCGFYWFSISSEVIFALTNLHMLKMKSFHASE